MKTFPNLVAAAAALLFAAVLAPAVVSLGIVALGLVAGTLWMGTVYLMLDRTERRDDARRAPVRVLSDADRRHR